MSIRNKLTLQFALITASILLMASFFIYYLSARYRQEEFYSRLLSKAQSTARLLIEVSEIDHDLLKIIDRNTISLPSEQILIYNYLNEEMYNSNEHNSHSFNEAVLDAIRLRHELKFRQGDKEFLGILYTDSANRFVVIASAVDVYGLRKLQNLQLVLISVFGGSMMLLVAAGWLFSHQALKPMAHVIRQVDQISATNLHARVDEGNSRDEIAQLSRTFNQMLDRVEAAFFTQKSFVANASHELRTPLTAITGQIEVSLLKDRNIQEYQQVLCSVLEDIRSLTHLTNVLLEMAQMSPASRKIHFEPVRIDELLLQSRMDLMQKRPESRIDIQYLNFPEEEYELMVLGNEPLLKSAISNILDNACKFSEGKVVVVTLDFHRNYMILTVADRGIGIQEEELKQVMEPLYRASNAISFQGHGLGLSLAQKILGMHYAEIKITSVISQGTEVVIRLPVAGAPSRNPEEYEYIKSSL